MTVIVSTGPARAAAVRQGRPLERNDFAVRRRGIQLRRGSAPEIRIIGIYGAASALTPSRAPRGPQ